MANELTVTAAFTYARGNVAQIARAINALGITVSSTPMIQDVLSVTTTEVAIPLGGVTLSSCWGWFHNCDATNYIELRVSTGSTKFCKLLAGEPALFRFGSGVTAPYAIADTATCLLEYVIFSA